MPKASSNISVKTTCPYCGVGCGVDAQIKDGSIEQISGQEQHPANLGRLCVKGSNLHQTNSKHDRLLHPYIDGKKTNWETALNAVAEKLNTIVQKHGPDSVAFYLSGQLLTEDYYVANKLIKGFIGTANVDTNSRLCMSSAVAGYKRAFGTDTVPCSYEDLEQAELIILIGSNAAWTHPVLYQRMVAAKQTRPDMKFVLVDPRKTATTDIADLHLQISPGSDGYLFNGLLNHLIANNSLDQHYIDSFTEGFDATRSGVASYSEETVSENCGINKNDLLSFYQLFSETEKVISFYSQGINQSSTGTDKCNAIINCHLATGKIGKPGAAPFSITGQPNAMGGREVGGLANQLAAHMDFAEDDVDRVKRFWNAPNIATKPGLKAVELFDAVEEGKIKAVWIMATNPSVSLPNANRVNLALEKCELTIVSDCIRNTDTTQFANVLFPATGWGEKTGTVTNSERRITRQLPLLPAEGEAKHDWWIISEVAKRMGFQEAFDYRHPRDIFVEHAQLSAFENDGNRDLDLSAMTDMSIAEFDTFEPIQWPVNSANPKGTKRMFTDGKFFTKSGKAQFIFNEAKLPVNKTSKKYPLILNTGRIRDQWHTMTRTGKTYRLLSHIEAPYIEIHPDDAKEYNLENNKLAKLHNQFGEFVGKVKINTDVRKGMVFSPIHWNDQFAKKGRISNVVNPVVDPVSGQPESKSTPIAIKPVETQLWAEIISQKELDTSEFDYWFKITIDEGYRYRVAIDNAFNWKSFISKQSLEQCNLIHYQDATQKDFRAVLLEKSQIQLAIFSCTDENNLPDSVWLNKLLLLKKQNEPHKILAGKSAEESNKGPLVCSCFEVGKNEIELAISQGNNTTTLLGDKLKCGTNCGSCLPELKNLIDSFNQKKRQKVL